MVPPLVKRKLIPLAQSIELPPPTLTIKSDLNADRGQHRLGCLAEAPVVGHGAAVGQKEIDPLGAVHRAAAADADDQVRSECRSRAASAWLPCRSPGSRPWCRRWSKGN